MIKRVYKDVPEEQRHTLYVFGSLEVRRTLFAGDAYTISNESLVPYAMANGVRLARLHYSDGASSPQVAGTGLGEQAYRTNTAATLHVLLELGDHLGSTGTVLDKLTSELVEKTTYLPFGARENDYRGTDVAGGSNRWSSFREDYGFTGKEEDVEVGLTYFGKRFLSPQLGRWVTADPLAVHSPGEADFNLYAYVSGAVLKSVDPVGLDGMQPEGTFPAPRDDAGNSLIPTGEVEVGVIEVFKGDSADAKRALTEAGQPTGSPIHPGSPGVPELADLKGVGKGLHNSGVETAELALNMPPILPYAPPGFQPERQWLSLERAKMEVAPSERSGALVGEGLALALPMPSLNTLKELYAFTREMSLSRAAFQARDDVVRAFQLFPNRDIKGVSTVVGGYNKSTGEVAVGTKWFSGQRFCAEDIVVNKLGGESENVVMTSAIRPSNSQTVDVCPNCQMKFTEANFAAGTPFSPILKGTNP